MIDGTLACEDANLKLVEVVTVADVDAEDYVGNILLIWDLTFGHKAKLFSDYEHAFVYRTLQRFGQYFEVEVQARFEAGAWASFFCWCFVKVLS